MEKMFSGRLRELRGDRSQKEMALLVGMKQQAYSKYESGENLPGYGVLRKICGCFPGTADWFLGLPVETPACVAEPPQADGAAPCPSCRGKDAVIVGLVRTVASQQETIAALSGRNKKKSHGQRA